MKSKWNTMRKPSASDKLNLCYKGMTLTGEFVINPEIKNKFDTAI